MRAAPSACPESGETLHTTSGHTSAGETSVTNAALPTHISAPSAGRSPPSAARRSSAQVTADAHTPTVTASVNPPSSDLTVSRATPVPSGIRVPSSATLTTSPELPESGSTRAEYPLFLAPFGSTSAVRQTSPS